jgi:Globin
MFAENPSLQKAFAGFADAPVSSLTSNAEYLKQVDLVADRLDNMIATLDNTLQIMGQFKYMGHSHAARGIDRSDFELFGRTFMAELAARGVSSADLEDFRAVLRVGVQRIAENLY